MFPRLKLLSVVLLGVFILAFALTTTLSAQSEFLFPWDSPAVWYFTGGPHGWGNTTGGSGLDFAPGSTSAVLAAAGGTVYYSGWNDFGHGNNLNVRINHGNGRETWYLHLSSSAFGQSGTLSVPVNIIQGQYLGEVGSTGGTAVHIHIELIQGGSHTSWSGREINNWSVHANCDGYTGSATCYSGNYNGYIQNVFSGTQLVPRAPAGSAQAVSSDNRRASDNVGEVGGIVRDAAGNPYNGATVTFNGSGQTRTTTSGSGGEYLFSLVPAGSATISAVKDRQAGQVSVYVNAYQSVRAPDIWLTQCTQNSYAALTTGCDIPTPTPQPPPPASGWLESFYSDTTLGSYCGSRNENDVYMFRDSDGDWRPPSGCPNVESAWSVRMERTDAQFQGGYYEFGLFYDDAAKLFVDDYLLVDGWNATQHYESIYLPAGQHRLRLEYKNNAGGAKLQLWWRGPGALPYNPNADPNQWWVNYWGNRTQWHDAVGSQNEGTGFIVHDWGSGGPGFGIPSDQFSVRFERQLYFPCGTYQFNLRSDDGSRLLIDGTVVEAYNHWVTGTWDTHEQIFMQAGIHKLQVDHFENGGSAYLYFDWSQESDCLPAAPTNLVVTQASFTSISLGWNDNSNNEDGFKMYRWTGAEWLIVGQMGPDATSFTDIRPCGSGELYVITAFNTSGESGSNWASGSTLPCPSETPTSTPTSTPTDTKTPTSTNTPTRTMTPTATPTSPAVLVPIKNPSFEKGVYTANKNPRRWQHQAWQSDTAKFVWDSRVAYAGTKSVKIVLKTPNDASWIQTVSVTPNTNYRFCGFIKTKNVAHTSGEDAGANLGLDGTWTHSEGLFGTNPWKEVCLSFNSEDKTQVTLAARLGYWNGTTTGVAWFDKLRLERY